MSDLIRRFRTQLGQKDFDGLDDTWLELLDSSTDVDEMLVLCDLAERHAPPGKGTTLLWLLADQLSDKDAAGDRLRVLRRLVGTTADETKLSQDLADCLRRLNPDEPLVERILQKAGLGYGQPLAESLPETERLLGLLPGKVVLDTERGPGRIVELDLLIDQVTVEYTKGSRESMPSRSASLRLRAVVRNGYFDLQQNDGPEMARLAMSNPGELAVMYLRDVGRRAGGAEIKQALSDAEDRLDTDAAWEAARRFLSRHPHVLIHTKPTRGYEWTEKAVPVRRYSMAARPSHRASVPSDLSMACPDDVIDKYRRLTSFSARKMFIEGLPACRPEDWPELVSRLFLVGSDRRARASVEVALGTTHPLVWRTLLENTVTDYRGNPEAFLWVLENRTRLDITDMASLLTRALDLMESAAHRNIWGGLRKALASDEYALPRAAFTNRAEVDVRQVLARIQKIPSLDPCFKDDLASLAAECFPAIGRSDELDVILSTARGIERARSELAELLNDDMPKSAEEIARARSQGDLSENYEYKAAKEKQARLVARISRLRADLARARPIDPSVVDATAASVGCRIILMEPSGNTQTYTLLGPWDSDPDLGTISYLAPFGQLLLGKKPGDAVELDGRLVTVQRIEPAPLD